MNPIIYQLGIGGIGGFFVGYAVRKVFKIAVVLGVFTFFLICLAYGDVIRVNYSELAESVSGFAKAVSPALGLLTPLVSHLPFIGSFILGLMFGFKKD